MVNWSGGVMDAVFRSHIEAHGPKLQALLDKPWALLSPLSLLLIGAGLLLLRLPGRI